MRDSATIYLDVFNVFPSYNPRHKDSNKYWYHFTSSVKESRTSTLARIEDCKLKTGAEGNVLQVTLERIKI